MPNTPLPFAGPSSAARALPVLILEDERFDRHRLARLCSALDFPCDIRNAMTLEDFSSAIDAEIFGLILLDYSLPDGTGLDAMNMIRLCARNLNTPVLMISGAKNQNIAREALTAGCREYLYKDALTSASFATAVKEALGTRTGAPVSGKEHFTRSEVAELLAHAMHQNARDIKPMVSRLMRQLRGLRSGAGASDTALLNPVEQNCMSLWAYLVEMEQLEGENILTELGSDQAEVWALPRDVVKPRKPPSPFSRVRH